MLPVTVEQLGHAIATAEGWGIPGSIPTVANNPGDLTGDDAGYFTTAGVMNKEGVVKFVDVDDGWSALHWKCYRILSGKSKVYPPEMTIEEMGMKYSGGNPNWAVNVARELGLSVTTTIAEMGGL